tara:strand:+ start:149 stop:250 length:102 start_codon:yes stop_codon:yes gene_type:complete
VAEEEVDLLLAEEEVDLLMVGALPQRLATNTIQ